MRLTKQPPGDVDVAVLTDGMVDVTSINGRRDHAGGLLR